MKTIKYIKIIIVFTILTSVCLFTGCEKYLDIKSRSALVTPNTIKSLRQLLDDSNNMNFASNSFAEASADGYFILQNTYNSISEDYKKVYSWTNFEYLYNNDWAKGYIPVYTANLVLESLDKIERHSLNEKEWNAIKGSALFFRAHQFLTLVWAYGKAYSSTTSQNEHGIVLKISSDPSIPSVRASLEESYQKIIEDIQESLNYLPVS